MNRKLLGGAVVGVLAAIAVWFFWLRGGDDRSEHAASTARDGKVPATEATPVKSADPAPAPRGAAPRWSLDADPEGTLILEGQVLGPDGDPVGGATVWLGSVPPRTTKTEDDGSFSFDKLVGRTYALTARSADLIGGPVSYKLTATSDPVVIRMAAGATLEVTVLDESSRPIQGADVREGEDTTAKTDAAGKATLRPVRPGWVAVEARAAGYAPNTAFTTIGGGTGQLTVTLRKGFAVSGKVVDEAGKPIAKAMIHPDEGMWGAGGRKGDIVTDARGEFEIPALAPGSYVLVAMDGEHAPARSNPITVKDHAVTGIVITMQAGGVFAGNVVTPDGKPVPFATVRITGKGEDAWMATTPRQATTDEGGAFEIRGLARTLLQARAESDTAASKIIDVDLVAQTAVRDARLVLDVTGQIAGVVVDESGAPVPEVQVNAFPDLLGGASAEGLALAGMSSTTTDGGGRFVITGLPDGAYRLWAARSAPGFGQWGERGVKASTGDKDVRIVLASPGKLVGKLALEGGDAPSSGLVQVGWNPPIPTNKDGEFKLDDLGPGSYDVTFRGPEFEETVRRDVKIEPGKETDLGTVVVQRGRRLTGKVIGKNGPVAGAKIKVGEMLLSADGNESQMDTIEAMYGTRSAVSDQNGEFTVIGISKKSQTVIAEHPELGRSTGSPIPGGTDDPPPVTLTLRAFGELGGVVTMQGKPQGSVQVSVALKDGGASAVLAQTDATGAFHLTRVPEGEVVIQAMKAGMMNMKSTTVTATVVAGKQTTVSIDIPVGDIALTVQIKPRAGQQVDAAQVFLLDGAASPTNAKQLTDGFFQGGAKGMKFWLGGDLPMPVFEELVEGAYSVCTIPITGDLSNPQFQQRLQANLEALKVYCQQVTVTPSPNQQSVVQEVPAMEPLPGG